VFAPAVEPKIKKKRSRKEPSEATTYAMCEEAKKILKQADLLHLLQ
jgi:hypothetical protein